jgi:hypothetical protein
MVSPRVLTAFTLAATFATALHAQVQLRFLDRLPAQPGNVWFRFVSPVTEIVDLDRDGFPDAAMAWHVSFADRRSGFSDWAVCGAVLGGLNQSCIGDVDRDGDLDMFAAAIGTAAPGSLMLNNGDRTFTDVSATQLPILVTMAFASTFADVDGDGDLDIVIGAVDPALPGVIYLNDGTGHYVHDPVRASMPVDVFWDVRVEAADLDGDGDVDLVIGRDNGYPCRVYLNDGSGHFLIGPALPPARGNLVRIGDIDGDGDLDIGFFGLAPVRARPTLCLNDGSARFADVTHRLPLLGPSYNYGGGVFADLDDDGDLDIAIPTFPFTVGPQGSLIVQQLVNDGTGHFTDATPDFVQLAPGNYFEFGYLQAADLDRDGDLDLIGRSTNPAQPNVLWNLTRQIYAPQPARLGRPWTLEVHGEPGSFALPAAALLPGFVDLGPAGAFGLDPSTTVTGPAIPIPSSRTASLVFQVPNDPGLVGRQLYWQCGFADPARGTLHLSNTFEETFGN